MPKVGASPGGAPSLLAPASRSPFDTSDTSRSLLVFSVSIRLTPFSHKPLSGALLEAVSKPYSERVRHQQHHPGHHDAGRGGVLEDLLRAADPIVYLGGQRHVAVERAGGDVGLVEGDPDYQYRRGLADGPRERQDDASE